MAQHDQSTNNVVTLIAPDIIESSVTGDVADLGVPKREEIALLQVGTVSNVDVAFVTLHESDNSNGPWFFVGLFSPIQAALTQQLRIKRKRRYLRPSITLEFAQPDEENPVDSVLPLSVALIQ